MMFESLIRDEKALELIFEGLRRHYIECITQNRLDVWAKAAHAAVDLLAAPNSQIHSRASLRYGHALAQFEVIKRNIQTNPRIVEARNKGANI